MLKSAPVMPTLPTTDIKRSKDFYVEKLGLTVKDETDGAISFNAGDGTTLYVYKRPPSVAEHTLASFNVEDLEATVDELSEKGIEFEQYDFEELKTNEKGIADSDDYGKAAWFKDPDGNILSIDQKA